MALSRASSLLSEAGGVGGAGGAEGPPQPASESATTAAPERVRNSRRFISFMGVLLSVGSPAFRGLWFWYSLHLQSAPSYAILMNRIRRCLLTRFVHSDRLSAPARDLFCLYCIIPGKKLPPQKSRFWGAIPKKFLGFWDFPLKKSPQKAQNWGDFGVFPTKTGSCSPACAGFPPLAAMCGKES